MSSGSENHEEGTLLEVVPPLRDLVEDNGEVGGLVKRVFHTTPNKQSIRSF